LRLSGTINNAFDKLPRAIMGCADSKLRAPTRSKRWIIWSEGAVGERYVGRLYAWRAVGSGPKLDALTLTWESA
jgi:hypothetical protein